MSIGFEPKEIRRLKAGATLTQYQVVKNDSTAGQVAVCGAGDLPLGIAMAAADSGDYVDIACEGVYKAVASASIAVGALVATTSTGKLVTANSSHAHLLGRLDVAQAAVVTDDVAAVKIDKQVVSIA
jgi:DUF1009 family protein